MSSTTDFDQLVRFTTDAAGLERTLRLFQSIAQILSSFPFALGVLLHILNTSTYKPHAAAAAQLVLQGINQRLNFARRFFRVFRWLESFSAAHKLHGVSLSPPASTNSSRLEATARWLDVLASTFNGMYLLLDASTIVDALQVEGLRLWTPEWERTMFVEGQRFWLFALVCGLFSSLLKMRAVVVERSRHFAVAGGESEKKGSRTAASVHVAQTEKQNRRQLVLGRKAVANALDILLPAVIVGWVDISPGVVGLAMFVTTILTGQEVWERCGGVEEAAAARKT
ncbi:peroxisomal biogenesis factor 11 [Cercophora scortea]|uniref:Peroxisomal biogenesis factor 11 n=1 Tax=Cercophora scortea TaxID=314031 RepID=A0AAE0M6F0_9PEZI|nr:peroxisomal biogenesis factor 11 [Cercophora scortea]